MDYICAPWRSEYFSKKPTGCPFCDAISDCENDELNGVLFRAKFCFGIMNLFPYSPGAFMVIPYAHKSDLSELSDETWRQMSTFVRVGVGVLQRTIGAQGVNIGMNLGEASGAGIAPHVHYHLVPRWFGDTNFITTIANTRVNGTPFFPIFKKIKTEFERLNLDENFGIN